MSKAQFKLLAAIIDTYNNTDTEDMIDGGCHLGTIGGFRHDTLGALYRKGFATVTRVVGNVPFIRPTAAGRAALA